MKNLQLMKTFWKVAGIVIVIGVLAIGGMRLLEVKAAGKILEFAETELAEVSKDLFGGYYLSFGVTQWKHPVVTMTDSVTIDGETRKVGAWLDEASYAYHKAYQNYNSRQSWKSELMANRAKKIYSCLNTQAMLERAEQQLAASSLNLFGGFTKVGNKTTWVNSVFNMEDMVGINGDRQTVSNWLAHAGNSMMEAYRAKSVGDCVVANMKVGEAVNIYSELNRKAGQTTEFWKLNPLAMVE